MLTAGHCGINGSSWNDASSHFYGTMSRNLTSYNYQASFDYAVINKPAGDILDLGFNFSGTTASTNSRYQSGGYITPYLGLTLCSSGSFSGENCNLTVNSLNQSVIYVNESGIEATYDALTGVHSNGTYAVWGRGDSGGPVYVANGTGGATIAGLISGGYGTSKPCKERDTVERACRSDGYFASFSYLKSKWNVNLNLDY
ncbi:S1 family peptidase [Paenarthrobacter ilicis]|uniref:hypothetical protein n=1 Tax=Paenarthrobacter ilicis TaxID=43665 RepID=UPI00300B442B